MGRKTNRASMLRWMVEPAMNFRGHSQASIYRPKTRLMTWRTGMGLTAPSRVLVRKSQNILGQKKPSMAAATWSEELDISTIEAGLVVAVRAYKLQR